MSNVKYGVVLQSAAGGRYLFTRFVLTADFSITCIKLLTGGCILLQWKFVIFKQEKETTAVWMIMSVHWQLNLTVFIVWNNKTKLKQTNKCTNIELWLKVGSKERPKQSNMLRRHTKLQTLLSVLTFENLHEVKLSEEGSQTHRLCGHLYHLHSVRHTHFLLNHHQGSEVKLRVVWN